MVGIMHSLKSEFHEVFEDSKYLGAGTLKRVHLSFANTSTGELTIKISTAKRKNRGNTLNIPLGSR